MIILVGGEKGGTGKTTLLTNLAAARAASGRDVLIVDTDRQGSASFWAAVREEDGAGPAIPCVQVFGKSVGGQVRDLSGRYDDVFVDAGGRDSVELRSAMLTADRLFIPLQASQFDVWTLERMDDLVSQAQVVNPDLVAAVVINRASTHPRIREAEEAEGLVAEFDYLGWTGSIVRDRIAYRRAASAGRSVFEAADPDPKAVAEIEAWYRAAFAVSVPTAV